jgi:hypothetical protein
MFLEQVALFLLEQNLPWTLVADSVLGGFPILILAKGFL